jgi:hypothetical protein
MADNNGSGPTCRFHSGIESKVEKNQSDISKLFDKIDELMHHVRPWVVWCMTGMGAVIGSLSTYVIFSLLGGN